MPEGTVNPAVTNGFGYLELSVTGADIAASMQTLSAAGVRMRRIRQIDALSVSFLIPRQDLRRAENLCAKRGDDLKILGRGGPWFWLRGLMKRPVLLLGTVFLLMASIYLPGRVFFVQVEGNSSVPTRQILEAAEQCGIGFGAARREVRSEKVKNKLLDLVPQLQWAGVNTRGCVAVITVRERIPEETAGISSAFGHIVALRDGVITECTAYTGTLLCAPGQAVVQGEILISGYTDCGLCIRAEQAQGEIYARTVRRQDALMPLNGLIQEKTGEKKRNISLIVGKKRINLWKDSGIWDTICDRMYEEYYVTLPGGFQLPLALAVETYEKTDISSQTVPEAQAQNVLRQCCESCLSGQMIGGTVLDSELNFIREDGCMRLTGQYICTEMIGKMQRQQIGENNGESD